MNSPLQNVNSIGVLTGRDLVGDALIKLPFARALRQAWPNSEIHWITSEDSTAFSTILRDATQNLIDKIHETPGWLATKNCQKISEPPPHFDLILDTRNHWKEALLARKLPHKYFIAMALRHLLSDRHPSVFKKNPKHLCDRLLQMVELATGYQPSPTGSLLVPQELNAIAEQLLPKGEIYIGLAPGCSTPYRMWPRERFIELAQGQIAQNRIPVFILGPQEVSDYEMLAKAVPKAKFPLQENLTWGTEQMTLNHTLAIAKFLTLGIANDSGPGHIMAAVDCPIISLFGPTTPLKAAPRASHVLSIRTQDFGNTHNMAVIPCDAVSIAIDQMLKKLNVIKNNI